jgi:DNA-binding beta-propeller fold protein YncE
MTFLRKWFVVAAAAGILTLLWSSCSSPQPQPATAKSPLPVWPPPPDSPRIKYVRSISGPADIGQRPPVFKRVAGFLTGASNTRGGLVKPFGVALDEAGNLCIADTGTGSVCFCNLGRHEWRQWEAIGDIRFRSPVAVARRDGCFYVADSELGKVLAFGEDGRQRWVAAGPLQRPAGLALGKDSLFVADSQAHAIFRFDLRGNLRSQFGRRGIGPGEFNFPTHIACDSKGRLLVTDSLNSRVQVFDSEGTFLSQIGSAGDTSGHFSRPKGVAVDSLGHVYVVDALFDNIQVFDGEGRLLLSLGAAGTGPGEFGLPAGIAIGADNQIYVADSYNRRIQVLAYMGEQ